MTKKTKIRNIYTITVQFSSRIGIYSDTDGKYIYLSFFGDTSRECELFDGRRSLNTHARQRAIRNG